MSSNFYLRSIEAAHKKHGAKLNKGNGGGVTIPRKTRVLIKKMYLEGHSARGIARQLGLDKTTTTKYTRHLDKLIKNAELEATKDAMIEIRTTTRSNVHLASRVVEKHLEEMLADPEKIKALTVRDVKAYASLSAEEYEKLRLTEELQNQPKPSEQPSVAMPMIGNIGKLLIQQFESADIVPHTQGKLAIPPALLLPEPPKSGKTTEVASDISGDGE